MKLKRAKIELDVLECGKCGETAACAESTPFRKVDWPKAVVIVSHGKRLSYLRMEILPSLSRCYWEAGFLPSIYKVAC